LGRVGGFVGLPPGGKEVGGPNGVVAVGNNEVWASDGDSTIKVIKLNADRTGGKVVQTISTGGKDRVDEVAYDPRDHLVAAVNNNACSNASGMTRPALPPKIAEWSKDTVKVDVDKETAIAFMRDSFDFCNKAVASMTQERLDQVVGPPARHMTSFEWLWAYFTHTAHHRGQAEVYLRVKGIKPPDYTF